MKKLKQQLIKAFGRKNVKDSFNELTLTIDSSTVVEVCTQLRDEFKFDILIDLSGIDYLTYGESDWEGNASTSGYGRAREVQLSEKKTKQSIWCYLPLTVGFKQYSSTSKSTAF